MLSQEEAVNILESNQIKSRVIKLGTQNHIKAKLLNGYSFHIKPDESKPGCLSAYLNDSKSGVLITWNEIDNKSLTFAIKNVKDLLDIRIKEKNTSREKTQEIKPVQINNEGETQLEQINHQKITTEKKLFTKKLWFVPTMVLILLSLIGIGYFAANRLIAVCNRESLEIRTP